MIILRAVWPLRVATAFDDGTIARTSLTAPWYQPWAWRGRPRLERARVDRYGCAVAEWRAPPRPRGEADGHILPRWRRACGFCNEGDLQLTGNQALHGGGREGTWTCNQCGSSVKLLDPVGRVVVMVLAVALTAAVPWAAVTSRVQHESERPILVLLVAALAAAIAALLVRDHRRQKKHPMR